MPRKTKAEKEAEAALIASESVENQEMQGNMSESMEGESDMEENNNMHLEGDALNEGLAENEALNEAFNEAESDTEVMVDELVDDENYDDSDAVLSMDVVQGESNAEAPEPNEGTPTPQPTPRRGRQRAEGEDSVLTLKVGDEVITEQDRIDTIWHEIKNSQVRQTPLTGIFGGMERLEGGGMIAVMDYKGQRIAIPLKEMMINIVRSEGESDESHNERIVRLMNKMLGAEMDFIVNAVDVRGRAAVASRKKAMLRLRQRFYLNKGADGKPQVRVGRKVEARITSVSQMTVRVEVFGVEATIQSRDLSHTRTPDARDEFFVGDKLLVKVTEISGDTPENLRIRVDIRSLVEDKTRENLASLKPQNNYIGTVTDVRKGVVFLRLLNGVSAIAHTCHDHRKPGRGDTVAYVVLRTDEVGGNAIGIISRITKRNLM